MRELEGVLEDVGQRRQDLCAVSGDAEKRVHLTHVERAAPRCRVVARGARRVGDEFCHGKDLFDRRVGRPSNLRHGIAQHRGHRCMAARDQAAGGSADRQQSHLQGPEGERRGLKDVAQLVNQHAKPLVLLDRPRARHARIALRTELAHRVGDRVVKAAVERAELVDRERRVAFDGEVGDGLAEVAVVVHDGLHGEAESQQFPAMRGGAHADLRQRGRVATRRAGNPDALVGQAELLGAEGAGELVEEHRDAVGELRGRGGASRALGHLCLASFDQVRAVVQQELVHANPR